jgi:C-terminal processing protease CtpA/Prc
MPGVRPLPGIEYYKMTDFPIQVRRNLKVSKIVFVAVLVIISVAFIKPEVVSADSFSNASVSTPSLSEKDRIEVFEKVWKSVNDKYFDLSFNGVDWNAARERYRSQISGLKSDQEFYALLNQMLGELRDAHTLFRTPHQLEASKKQQATSVGISIRVVEAVPVIFSVDRDSDAAQAGIETGMMVRTIDGQPFTERLAQAQEKSAHLHQND